MNYKIIKLQHLQNVNQKINSEERNYIEENLQYFIQREAKYTRSVWGDEFHIESDHTTRLRLLLLEFILDHFTLWELYIIFFANQSCYYLEADNIQASKQTAIECINADEILTREEKKKLKRKVWELSSVLFGQIHELIHLSDLFWDKESDLHIIPIF